MLAVGLNRSRLNVLELTAAEEQLSVIGHEWCGLSILHGSPADLAPDGRALTGFQGRAIVFRNCFGAVRAGRR